jgi:hypothetical protein
LAARTWDYDRASVLAHKLDVPRWQAHFPTALQCRELLHLLDTYDLDSDQRKRANRAVARLFIRRQVNRGARRSRKLLRILLELGSSTPTRSMRACDG